MINKKRFIKWLAEQIICSLVLLGVMFIGWLVCYLGYLLGVL